MSQPPPSDPKRPATGRETYNAVSDTVTGVNIRGKDNLYQGLFVGGCSVIAAIIGYLLSGGKLDVTLGFTLVALVVSVLISGLFIAIYRGIRHMGGKHD